MVRRDIKIRDIITKQAVYNAIRVNAAIGGSTNAVLHLLAIAYEGEIEMSVFEFGKICEGIPHLVPLILPAVILCWIFMRPEASLFS